MLLILGGVVLVGALLLAGVFFAAKWHYGRQLPSVAAIRDIQLQVPLRVYTRDAKLIGEFGAERRAPMRFDKIPQRVIDAFLAAEDDRFFEHPGFDWKGLLRAGFVLATTGQKSQGGSTITMQLARNVFLSPERSYVRKFKEILLATKLEHELSKQEILETYLNKIFLGQRAYGVGAASLVYFGVEPDELSWAQAAMLAGLPKAPSRDNPVSAPERAKERRNYVLRRLRDLNKISELDYQAGIAEPVTLKFSLPLVEVDAHYVAEMVRADMVGRFGEAAYTGGYRVTTTIDSTRQAAANRALRSALIAYDERHGWRGAETRLPERLLAETTLAKPSTQGLGAFLDALPSAAGLVPAAVVAFEPGKPLQLLARSGLVELAPEDYAWARLSAKKPVQRGDVLRVRRDGERWKLAELPEAQGALVALDPRDGSLVSLVGGYDFLLNKYNRVLQAHRQVGSGFKPFLYTSAFQFGFTPASVVLDAPVVFDDANLESAWRPENYGGDFKGPMRLREALVQSRNLVSVRLLQAVGVDYARDFISRFGLPKDRMPRDLSMALGSGTFTPMEMARAYSALANGGFLVEPYFIDQIDDSRGQTVFKAKPKVACPECAQMIVNTSGRIAGGSMAPAASGAASANAPVAQPSGEGLAPRVVDASYVWMVDDILREVVTRGTAAQAKALGRGDIRGKTGTTNDETDAWFNGFTSQLVAISWVGFDQPQPLGRGEVGGKASLPMWMDFMRAALKGLPETVIPKPDSLVAVAVDPRSGHLVANDTPGAVPENIPAERLQQAQTEAQQAPREKAVGEDDLF
ncbi:penicillin-binding protein 1A [Hydrocarboniphaga sp.]|uniref:penicillin-binding protein 1A n=1 Tax=Hydrocarboniphaga sp. TaxID=2033016 RepID=UPI003D11464F